MPDLRYFLDCSNYQTADISGLLATHRPDGVVVRASGEDNIKRSIAVAQCRQTLSAGKILALYDWSYSGQSAEYKVAYDLEIAAEAGGRPAFLAPDIEPGSIDSLGPQGVVGWVNDFGRACQTAGVHCLVYTSPGIWRQFTGDSTACNWLYLWLAVPDEDPRLVVPDLPGGWTQDMLVGKQWSWKDGVDRDVFRADLFAQPTPAVPAPADEVAALRLALADVCDRIGDALAVPRLPKQQRLELVAQMRRERAQFIGARA